MCLSSPMSGLNSRLIILLNKNISLPTNIVRGIFFLEVTEYVHVFFLGIVDKTFLTLFCTAASLDSPIACVAGAWKQWAQERTGAREGYTHARSFLRPLLLSTRLAQLFPRINNNSKLHLHDHTNTQYCKSYV